MAIFGHKTNISYVTMLTSTKCQIETFHQGKTSITMQETSTRRWLHMQGEVEKTVIVVSYTVHSTTLKKDDS